MKIYKSKLSIDGDNCIFLWGGLWGNYRGCGENAWISGNGEGMGDARDNGNGQCNLDEDPQGESELKSIDNRGPGAGNPSLF